MSEKHGHIHRDANGKKLRSPEYIVWESMKQRVFNVKHKHYKDYGGRGITVCERWKNSFVAFFEDMGIRQVGMTLDRKDVNGNYEKDNCVWASARQQARNRRPRKKFGRDSTETQTNQAAA